MIINLDSLEISDNGKEKTFGFVIDVSKLFELYLVKLLRLHFGDEWEVVHEDELEVYQNSFFARKMLPDIVMKQGDKVIVFDAKYKKMKFRGTKEGVWDLDRNDFFQIHTYMSYYKSKGKNVIAGGLLYPIESKFEQGYCHSSNWLGDNEIYFIVDGIDLSDLEGENMSEIKKREDDFVNRIRKLIEGSRNDPQ